MNCDFRVVDADQTLRQFGFVPSLETTTPQVLFCRLTGATGAWFQLISRACGAVCGKQTLHSILRPL